MLNEETKTLYRSKPVTLLAVGRGLIEIAIGCLALFGIVWWLVNGYLQLEISSGMFDLFLSMINLCFGLLLLNCGVMSFIRPAGLTYLHITAGFASIIYGIPGQILTATYGTNETSFLYYVWYASCGFLILLFTVLILRNNKRIYSQETAEE
ncbi:MAG: hypothetical protein JW738_08065 [Actinobacteria bacterium]|nr:hypothetical protein [Actinomycetota bacterium]